VELYWRNLATHEESYNMVIHRISWYDKDPKMIFGNGRLNILRWGRVTLTKEELLELRKE